MKIGPAHNTHLATSRARCEALTARLMGSPADGPTSPPARSEALPEGPSGARARRLSEAERFLTLLDEEAETFCFQTFDDSGKRRELARTIHGTLGERFDLLDALNRGGAGVFVTVNEVQADKPRTAANVSRVRACFADFDGTAPPEVYPLEPVLEVESSPGKRHAYWTVEGLELDAFEAQQRGIAAALGSDGAVIDLPRVMRLPGFRHMKDPRRPHWVRVIASDPRQPYKPADLARAFPPVVKVNGERPDPGADPIARALSERGLVLRAKPGGGLFVTCPWSDEHTTPSTPTSTAYFPPHTGGYSGAAFKCQHSHCQDRTAADLRRWLGLDDRKSREPSKSGATGATGATALNSKAEIGSPAGATVGLPGLPTGATDPDNLLDTATDPAGPPDLAQCPCWRVYGDWWQDGSVMRRPGVWYHGREEREGNEVRTNEWLCGPLYLDAITADSRGENFGRLLRFRDAIKRWHTWNMPMRLLKGSGEDLRGELLSLGLELDPKGMRSRLHAYLVHRVPERRVTAALRVGWHGETFVLPDRSYGPGASDVHYQSESAAHAEFSTAGSLDDWREHVAALAPENMALTLAISAAFAGPLMSPTHVEHAGVHFVAESSTGKSTALQAAASVWGPPGYIRTWRATSNGLEAAAVESNDALLVLDEVGESDPAEIGRVIYGLGNGRGKSRANVLGLARQVAQWRTVLLSSGEKTIEAHQAEGRQRSRAGQSVRLLDIPAAAAHGTFDVLHGHPSGRHLADAIKSACARHYGVAGRAFLEHVTSGERPDYGALIASILDRFGADGGQEARAARQLALLALAGETATAAGITGWPAGAALAAALAAFEAWRTRRGAGNAEPRQIMEQVRDFIDTHSDSRFSPPGTTGPVVRERAGWIETDPAGRLVHLFTRAGMREAVAGHDLTRALSVLRREGWLIPGGNGKNTVQRKIDRRNVGLYAIVIPDDGDAPC